MRGGDRRQFQELVDASAPLLIAALELEADEQAEMVIDAVIKSTDAVLNGKLSAVNS